MIPIPHLGRASAHPKEAMNSIHLLQQTGHAIKLSQPQRLLPREPRQRLFFPQPHRPIVVARLVKRRQQVVDRHGPASRLSPQLRQARVHHDAVQPRPQGRIPRKLVQATERRQEGVLHGVGAILFAAKEPAGNRKHAAAVLPHEHRTGFLVTGPDTGQELGFRLLLARQPTIRPTVS